eukprot:Blabericola_migrator_1__3043@NODE_1886_length_3606_cov_46_610059_g1208_i0_p3_GENE_NODE_1886_length_3606_cov_46_610059_g1208_i0NODE_1886_length_3606_cov_46_610059_g1208_i0_p3_ORF_typecomplete_len105_score1_35Glyco_hydro_130/PF04041_13/0_28_NODE_1886_length_3606_cov_46_610059_g1208_i0670984
MTALVRKFSSRVAVCLRSRGKDLVFSDWSADAALLSVSNPCRLLAPSLLWKLSPISIVRGVVYWCGTVLKASVVTIKAPALLYPSERIGCVVRRCLALIPQTQK